MRSDRIVAVVLGGSEDARGGVEQFSQRLLGLTARMGFDQSIALPTNTAILRGGAEKLLVGVRRAVSTFSRNLVGIRGLSRQSERVVVILQYGNAVDLAYVLLGWVVRRCEVYVVAHCSSTWSHLHRPMFRPLIGALLRIPNGVGVLSEEQAELFGKIGVRRLIRVPTLLGIQATSLCKREFRERPDRSLIFCGRVSPEKGVIDAIELVRRLSIETGETWSLDVYGAVDDAYRQQLGEARALAIAAGACVEFHGFVSFEQLVTKLCNTRFQAYLSVQDAFPLSVLEAIAAGACPVVYALPGTREIVDRWGGIVAEAGDLNELVRRLRTANAGDGGFLASAAVLQQFSEPGVLSPWVRFLRLPRADCSPV